MEFLWLGHMKDGRLIQCALDLNPIDCGECSRCEPVSVMCTAVSFLIYRMLPVLCLCHWLRSVTLTLLNAVV